jgi:hypothetical protein
MFARFDGGNDYISDGNIRHWRYQFAAKPIAYGAYSMKTINQCDVQLLLIAETPFKSICRCIKLQQRRKRGAKGVDQGTGIDRSNIALSRFRTAPKVSGQTAFQILTLFLQNKCLAQSLQMLNDLSATQYVARYFNSFGKTDDSRKDKGQYRLEGSAGDAQTITIKSVVDCEDAAGSRGLFTSEKPKTQNFALRTPTLPETSPILVQ